MSSQVHALLVGVPAVATYTFVGMVAAIVVVSKLSKGPNIDAIPTVGSSSWLSSWLDGFKFATNATEVLQEGYEKYKSAPFKVAAGYRWIIVLSNHQHLEEVRKAHDDELSFHEAVNDVGKTKYTMSPELADNPYHFEIVRSQLTRSIASLYHEIRDEISVSFDEVLALKDHEWKNVPALAAIQNVVCRTSNRLFVGLPLCRDSDWLDLNVRYTVDVGVASGILQCIPDFLEPLVAKFMTKVMEGKKRGMKLLAPIIEERLRLLEKHGKDWAEKPNDILSWLLELAPEGSERTVKLLTIRILSINFAAIHTSSSSFTNALFYLAENPQYIQPLREEVESIVEKERWSKASLGKMHKIDSFLKECQRLIGISTVSLFRKATKDFTFLDGTFIPKGTMIAAPSHSLHLDNKHYPNAHVFDPFRFSNMRGEDGASTKHQFVSTSLEYLAFGHGKYACPGRFFAANELKSMLAHLVVSYDVKLEDGKARPKGIRVGGSIAPDPTAKVMFRKRVY